MNRTPLIAHPRAHVRRPRQSTTPAQVRSAIAGAANSCAVAT